MSKVHLDSIQHEVLGGIWFAVNDNGLFALDFPFDRARFIEKFHITNIADGGNSVSEMVKTQLLDYLNGTRKVFDLPIDWSVFREFQQKALRATFDIPYGMTKSYKQVAEALGSPNGARAVGRAEATNAIPIVIPCHRVLGSTGSLHGYGSGVGLPTKEWLLNHERSR